MTVRSDSSEETLKILGEQVRNILPEFSDRDQSILKLRFNLEGAGILTLEAVAAKFGITRKAVREIEVKAMHLSRQK